MSLWDSNFLVLSAFVASGLLVSITVVVLAAARVKISRTWTIVMGLATLALFGASIVRGWMLHSAPAVETTFVQSDYIVWGVAVLAVAVAGAVTATICHKRGYFSSNT